MGREEGGWPRGLGIFSLELSMQVNRSMDLSVVALVFALVGILYPLPGFFELYHVAPGSSVRPMGLATAFFLAGLGTPLIVVPLGISAIYRPGKSRMIGWIALLLSAVPLPLHSFLFHWIVHNHGLHLKP